VLATASPTTGRRERSRPRASRSVPPEEADEHDESITRLRNIPDRNIRHRRR
jgi:hypothetical protein